MLVSYFEIGSKSNKYFNFHLFSQDALYTVENNEPTIQEFPSSPNNLKLNGLS
jgi:hypothetical protein